MKGVICAGGAGSRLFPLTRATNKHLLPIYDKPMIYYPIQTLVKAGIKEVLIVVGGEHAGDFIKVLQNGEEFGLKDFNYAYQKGGRAGIADAVSYAEDFADGDNITVILGDNTTDSDISKIVKSFKKGAEIFLKEVSDPSRYGVPVFDKNMMVIKIEEKPKKPKSKYAVTGLYIYDNKVFDYIKSIKLSRRGELEITDVNNCYLNEGKLSWSILEGYWNDAGTFDGLFGANSYWAHKLSSV